MGTPAEASFSPLDANAVDYDYAWAMYMGYGVSGVCWRGPRIFDGPKSKGVVAKWVAWYKNYRSTLTSGALIHVRRPDGQGVDAILHANARGTAEKGIIFTFNPSQTAVKATLKVDLYYTGINDTAQISFEDGAAVSYALERDYSVIIPISMAPESYAWWTVQ